MSRPLRIRSLVRLGLAGAIAATFASTGRAAVDGPALDAVVAKAMEFWQVPGLAVAVVEDGAVAFTRTYGVRDAERALPVTAGTVFALGSLSKSLTATGLARLVDRGQVAWDGRVVDYVPDFRLMDASGTAALTVRHLLTHTSGLPRHDALWYLDAYTRPEIVARLRHLAPFGQPGSDFAYSNLMVAVAGTVAERVSGLAWDEFIRTEVLGPAGLVSATSRLADFLAAPDRALGYFPALARRVPQPIRDTDPVAPAAGFYADVADAARYLLLHTERARELLRPETWSALTTPSFVFRANGGNYELGSGAEPEITFEAYGMGFYVLDYRGVRTVRHTGVIDGYAAVLSFIPDRRAGVVVLTNLSGDNPVPTLLERAVYDRLLGLEPVPWFERFSARTAARREQAARLQTAEIQGPPPGAARPLEAYRGAFRHAAYGDMAIEPAANGRFLAGRLHKLTFALRPLGGDLFAVPETVWPLREGLRVRFEVDGAGNVLRLSTPLADGPTYRRQAGPIVFERVVE